jgi:broad specificity phosphatase PhoE
MSEIFVVRHGQASARARNYDVLSPLGVQQAQRLGAHLAQAGVRFDAVFAGPRQRHRDTAHHLVAAARQGGASMPDVIELPDCDELPLGHILMHWLPRHIDSDPVARAVAEQRWEHSDDEIRSLLGRAMQAWAAGEVADATLLTFAGFVARIEASLAAVRAAGATTLMVTSAGPLATTLHLCGHDGTAQPVDVMRLVVEIENTAVARVIHDGARLTVAAAHDVSHLADGERSLM